VYAVIEPIVMASRALRTDDQPTFMFLFADKI